MFIVFVFILSKDFQVTFSFNVLLPFITPILPQTSQSALVPATTQSRIDYLRKMVAVLKGRSGADIVFVSPSSNSSGCIASRDTSSKH
ncbi:hypothetical protein VTP01DRAFT_315, partial [Rhizomucor pusillus]|uniref:uncharacterized protein n=1 Tax=Rhizomucor pusillus TaxID=4840 RepID=UPI0037445CA1